MSDVPEWLSRYDQLRDQFEQKDKEIEELGRLGLGVAADALQQRAMFQMARRSLELCYDLVERGVDEEAQALLREHLDAQIESFSGGLDQYYQDAHILGAEYQKLIKSAVGGADGGRRGSHKDRWNNAWADLMTDDEWRPYAERYSKLVKGQNAEKQRITEEIYSELWSRFVKSGADESERISRYEANEWRAIKGFIRAKLDSFSSK